MRSLITRLFPAVLCYVSISATLLSAQVPGPASVNENITWTEVPLVDKGDPTLQRGIVYGPDGKPLEGAKIYAASTIELFEISSVDEVTVKDLGEVRAITDQLGRFEFHTPDLTWMPTSGQRKRWEALLVASKEGMTPGWIRTWGEDRGLRSHWHPHPSKQVEIHLAKPMTLHGRLLGPDDKPIADAKVSVTQLHVPLNRDLDEQIDRLENLSPFAGSIGYHESISRPWLIPGLVTEHNTDADGKFALEGFPAEYIAKIKVSQPAVQTTELSVAMREMDPVYRQAGRIDPKPKLMLYGSGFTHKLTAGVTLRGQVTEGFGTGSKKPVVGATVALANHNADDGMTGERFKTNDEGRFEITGIGPDYSDPGYVIAVVGSYDVPIQCKRFTIHEGKESRLQVPLAVPYQLKLTDVDGKPVDRDVSSIVVQRSPNSTHHSATSRFNKAVKVAPGIYQGIVPVGPGAVIVSRNRRDRPASVDPKAFFQPGRTDWTAAEARYAYGDQWQVTGPGIVQTSALSPSNNAQYSQLEMAGIVFTNGTSKSKALQLEATVITDEPPSVTLVDEAGKPINGVRVKRQLTKYNDKNLPATFPLYGLHPDRAEFIQFHHDERRLIGFLRATLTDEPLQVVMKPAALLTGRIVNKQGEATKEFGALVEGAVPPHTYLGNFIRNTDRASKGRFGMYVPPNESYSGKLMRKTFFSWYPRPIIGEAFGPVTPKPGETVDLGDIVAP